jgi:hypothetical protein
VGPEDRQSADQPAYTPIGDEQDRNLGNRIGDRGPNEAEPIDNARAPPSPLARSGCCARAGIGMNTATG